MKSGFVLYWGKSNRELELILESAKKFSVDVRIIDPRKLSVLLDSTARYLLYEGERIDVPDFVIAAFAKDPSYRNVALLQQLEALGVLCVNRSSVMLKTKDKMLTLQLLAAAGIPVPKTMLFSPYETNDIIEQQFSFPLVLKVIGGSKGDGVVLVKERKHLDDILKIAHAGGIREELIIQELVAASKGRDLRVVIVGGKAVTCAQRTAAVSDGFKSNYSSGGSISSYTMTPKIEEISNRIASVLGLFIGGIDLLFDGDDFVVCEVNSVPGCYISDDNNPFGTNIHDLIIESIKDYLEDAQGGI